MNFHSIHLPRSVPGGPALCLGLAAWLIGPASIFPAAAQPLGQASAAALAQQRYDRDVAACNRGTLPAPQHAACIRDAGRRLDRARGGPAEDRTVTTSDGRATVVAPAGSTLRSSDVDGPLVSRDGRATVVPAENSRVPN